MVKIDSVDEKVPANLVGSDFTDYIKEHPEVTKSPEPDEEVEPIAKPSIKGKQAGQMQAAKGGKPAGEATEFGGHEGYDAGEDSFEEKHPHISKAVGVGKKALDIINKKTAGYVKDTEGIDRKLKELERKRKGEDEGDEKPKKKSKSKKKSLKDDLDFNFEDEDDEDITALHKATSKQKVLPGDYKSAYGGGMGKKGYESVFKGEMGTGTYQPAYKPTVGGNIVEEPTPRKPVKSAMEELTPRRPIPAPQEREPDRFNTQKWQSLGFPNTLPQSARGSLFRPAPQQQVVPMVRQPYQPKQPMPAPVPRRAPMSGPMPRIGLNINATPQIMKPRTTITPPRAPSHVVQKTAVAPAPMTFMGVTLGEKKKQEPNKPITKMGEGYKNIPLVVMNSIYPSTNYNPNKDPITKKSIIPKIHATVSPHDFTMFGMRVKNKKS